MEAARLVLDAGAGGVTFPAVTACPAVSACPVVADVLLQLHTAATVLLPRLWVQTADSGTPGAN